MWPFYIHSNGSRTDMMNTYFIAQTAKLVGRLKSIILVINYNFLLFNRGKSMRSCMQTLLEIFSPSQIENSQTVNQLLWAVSGESQ